MNNIDWSTAPEGAEFYAYGGFRKIVEGRKHPYVWITAYWTDGGYTLVECAQHMDYQPRPTEWPTEDRTQNIGQNGGDGLHYDEQRELKEIQEKMAAREAHLKQSAEQNRAPDSLGKYDRRIKGKYNTGACTVDVYRVLSAFEITEPELQHAIKKLLAAGQRGTKDYQQDLREAAISLSMLIDRLQE